jgi:YggT family protein
VTALLPAVDVAIELVRRALFALAVVLFAVCAVDWLVRTRRVSPFGAVARFFRKVVDPLLVPVERRVVRAGGLPSAAPWWALGAVIVGGIMLLLLLDAVRALAGELIAATRSTRGVYQLLVSWTFGILQFALLVRVVASWLRVSAYVKWLRWCYSLTEWMLRPLRRVIPMVGMMDITPLVAIVLLMIARTVLLQVP